MRAGQLSVILTVVCTSGLFTTVTVQPQEPADVETALADARRRALAGDVVAQFSLGSLIYSSGGDPDQVMKWLRMAAGQGYAPAEFHLGQLSESGFDGSMDFRTAAQWYEKAAARGLPPAQRALAELYRTGRGVPQEWASAARLYRLAAEAGDLLAQYHLGQLYFDGSGVPRDYVRAYVWFDRAAAQTPLQDNRKALIELRDIAAVRMSPDELDLARLLVRDLSPTR